MIRQFGDASIRQSRRASRGTDVQQAGAGAWLRRVLGDQPARQVEVEVAGSHGRRFLALGRPDSKRWQPTPGAAAERAGGRLQAVAEWRRRAGRWAGWPATPSWSAPHSGGRSLRTVERQEGNEGVST